MEEESVNVIRESRRRLLMTNRRCCRDREQDQLRHLSMWSLPQNLYNKPGNPEDVLHIAGILKTKAAITFEELSILKNHLADSAECVQIFLSVHGALRGLVRELTGHDVNKQCAAAACVCNMTGSLPGAAPVLCSAAAAYLVPALDSLSRDLASTCALSAGNMAGGSTGACAVLVSQGALSKLVRLLTRADGCLTDAALYALLQLAHTLRDDLSVKDLQNIIRALNANDTLSSWRLHFILSCHRQYIDTIHSEETFIDNIMRAFLSALEKHSKECNLNTTRTCCEILHAMRTLANVCSTPFNCDVVLNTLTFLNCNEPLKAILGANSVIQESLLWFLGNIYTYSTNYQLKSTFFNKLL